MRGAVLSVCILLSFFAGAQKTPPKLVVGIVVDQMRYDYLTRFWDKLGSGGFKKIIKKGYNCKNTHYNYMPTYTGPGHASIYTGTTPAQHGIIANNWYDMELGHSIYCVGDEKMESVGSTSEHGKMSPNKLLTTTITDELKLATGNKGKVITMSLKDRGAVLPGGQQADGAYWYDGDEVGKWITSTFYVKELPLWVQKVNERNTSNQYLSKPWNTLLPIKKYTESIADNNHYEGVFNGEDAPVFPHDLPALRTGNSNYSLIKSTPFGNTILKELAIAAIMGEGLGEDEFTDFLAISFSSPDYIGHKYGPKSIEVEDTYLRLDKDLEALLNYLKKGFKKGEVLLFLTADHGVAEVPQYLLDQNEPAGYFDQGELKKNLKGFLKEQFDTTGVIKNVSNFQVFLNHEFIQQNNLDASSIETKIAQFLATQEGIAKTVTRSGLKRIKSGEIALGNTLRGHHKERSGDVMFVLKSGWIPAGYNTGTTHGSPYSYDTHVPLLWYGAGVKKGSSTEKVVIPDIAATLSILLGINAPNGCTGKPIQSLLK